jgi:hypothetical protein
MLKGFWRAISARWFTTMSGPVGVPLTALGALSSDAVAAKIGFAATCFACFLFTAYWIWSEERKKVIELQKALDPKLSLHFEPTYPFLAPTTIGDVRVLYIRALPKCDAQVTNCRGILDGVMKWERNQWQPTAYAEAQNLVWSNFPNPSDRLMRLDPGVQQMLDVLRIRETAGGGVIDALLVGGIIPNNALDVFSNGGTFRFDATVSGDGNAHASISLIVIPSSDWNRPTIRVAITSDEVP